MPSPRYNHHNPPHHNSPQTQTETHKIRPTPTIPTPQPSYLGHLPYLLTQPMPHYTFTKLAQAVGPIFRLQLGRVNTVVVSSAHYAQLILKAHDHVFSDRPQLLVARILSFDCSDVTFSTYGPYWRQARKICVTELLSPRRVAAFHRVRVDEVNRLVENLISRSGTAVNLSKKLFELSNDVLCRVAFGRRFSEGEGSRSDLVGVLTETQALLAGFCAGDFFSGMGVGECGELDEAETVEESGGCWNLVLMIQTLN
ncbi:unnamed protein product [Rhodiola kirilowii]